MAPLRCHLLIGQPASGKTTLARVLAPLLSGPGEPEAVVLSTDAIRAEVFGDAAVQGPWPDIQQRLHQRIREAVAAGIPVIVDATHARRAWRLAITQALELPAPVEWIGWWLYTDLPTSLAWNAQRERPVPVPVVQEMAAALADPHFGPSRAEGFAAICAVVPSHHQELTAVLQAELAGLDRRIRSATNRERKLQRHGYSRLLDLERLLYLIRLLSRWPDLSAADPATAAAMEAILSPLPEGDLAARAAAFLGRLHGECYADSAALWGDLAWLEANGFCSALPSAAPIQLAPLSTANGRSPVHGGLPPLGDGTVFLRVMTLLRHLLQQAFDRPVERGANLHEHLIAATSAIPGGYLPGETATLRKDLEKLLTPYGFRARHDNVRHGYSLGTALLSPSRLLELRNVVEQAAGRLADPSAQDLLTELDRRLDWAGISQDDATPVRRYARHTLVDSTLVRRDSLATPQRAEQIESAIVEHRRVHLQRFSGMGRFADSPEGYLRVWPLQLIFHNVGWYLIYEEDHIGQEHGLIRSERLDRLSLSTTRSRGDLRRSSEDHRATLQRLEQLLHLSGGIYFGDDLEQQMALSSGSIQRGKPALVTLRFCCAPWAFAFIREGLQRYPIEHTRFSRPLPGDTWWHHPRAPHVLDPGPEDATHPYPVELDLPPWTVGQDVDLRNWLFAFGGGVRIEQPDWLRVELIKRCQEGMEANGGS